MANGRIDVREHLQTLVGETINTRGGAPNRVLEVRGDQVVVATDRSPGGRPIPLKWLEGATQALIRNGEVRVDKEPLKYRSAFIRAFLLTIPGARLADPNLIRLDMPVPQARARCYWTIRTSPEVFDVETALNEIETCLWTTKGKDVRKGDRLAIWKLKAGSSTHGVVALGEVLSDPLVAADDSPYWRDRDAGDNLEPRALGRLVIPPYLPIWMPHPVLNDLNAAKAHGGAVFHMTPEQWDALLVAAGGWPEAEVQDALLEVARMAGRPSRGQAFSSNQQIKRAVELLAMREATAYYESRGWRVEDRSGSQPFDLLCRRPGEELHVEVKGTTSSGETVLVTQGEVKHAMESGQSALFVLCDIEVADFELPQVRGGRRVVVDVWAPEAEQLTPVGYVYTLPTDV